MPTAEKGIDPTKGAKLYTFWMGEIEDSLKREKSYRQRAQKCVEMYEAKQPETVPFAILYSNTETLAPAIYNSKPIPMVMRRFKDADPLGKAVSEVSTRTLKYLLDVETADYDPFDELMQPAVLDALITNRGVTRFKFVATEEKECVHGEMVRWDKFFHGYARSWKKVPWIGFEWDMSLEEIRANLPEAQLDISKFSENDAEDTGKSSDETAGVKTYKVYEIWDKRTSLVMFFTACCPKMPAKIVQDPLGLSGFFPTPKPLNFMRKITTLIPTPLYEQYRQQAQELNEITRRLKAIIRAVKYRGAYNSAVEGIDKMLQADDNELVPVENMASMPEGIGIDKLIWTVPTNELATTAQQLYQQREQVKQVIYEITGISDILRGASTASETATAQNIKNQWGTLRLKKMQKEVQRYCRDSLIIMLEIAGSNFDPQTFKTMTGLPYLMAGEKEQLKSQMAMVQQQSQATGQEMPPPPPEVQQLLESPTWEEIIQVLSKDTALHYRVDIETNSTLDAEAAQDKQDISELLNALSQFLNGLAPLVQTGFLPFTIAKDMMLTISRRYNFGSQLEDSLNSMQEPPKQGEDPAAGAKHQAEMAKAQFDTQKATQDAEISKAEFEQKKQLMILQLQIDQAELGIKREELQLQSQAVTMKLQQQTAQHKMKMEQMQAKEKEPSNADV